MGLLDQLLGDDGKSERSLSLKAKPLKDAGGKSEPNKDQVHPYGAGGHGFNPYRFPGATDRERDNGMQYLRQTTAAPTVMEVLGGAYDALPNPLGWITEALFPRTPVRKGPYVDPEEARAAEQARLEMLQQRVLQNKINNK